MKRTVFEQFAIVKEDSAALFTARLNEQLYDLRDSSPAVRFSENDPLCAYINYTKVVEDPETASEKAEAEGVKFCCYQCPVFKAPTKEDGTEDKRCKWGECEHAELGRVPRHATACDYLYELIASKEVRLCFTK